MKARVPLFPPSRSKMPVTVPPLAKPQIDASILSQVNPLTSEEGFVYVHCHYANMGEDMFIRIWKTTFLLDASTLSHAGLVHIENISYAPQWTIVPNGTDHHFLLVFSSLPKSCKVFDLIEDIPQPGGFRVRGIPRNHTDVYHINL